VVTGEAKNVESILETVSACGALGEYCKFETLTKKVFEISTT
jgi:hypothetical protein